MKVKLTTENKNPFTKGYYLQIFRHTVKKHNTIKKHNADLTVSNTTFFTIFECKSKVPTNILFEFIPIEIAVIESLKTVFEEWIKRKQNKTEDTSTTISTGYIENVAWYKLDETCDTYKKFVRKYPEVLI